MGKKLIIKGADFSANGMKSVSFMEAIFSNDNIDTTTFQIVGNGLPLTSFLALNGTMEIVADINNNNTAFSVIRGTLSGDRSRLVVQKEYKSGSTGENPFELKIMCGSGSFNGKVTLNSGDFNIILKGKSLMFNDTSADFTSVPTWTSDPLENVALYSNRGTCVKYKRITFKNVDGDMIANYLPAVDDNGKAALYETISKTFIYPNSSSTWECE